MQATNGIAFKEWAVICAALAEGQQTIILRKGGIHEGREGFRVAHREFWLFPTYLHEDESSLVADASQTLARVMVQRPPAGELRLAQYAVVTDVFELRDEVQLSLLTGLHWWSERTVGERFHYRDLGLFALIVRAYTQPMPHVLVDSPHFAGCRSWVELPQPLPTASLQPVLGDAEFEELRHTVQRALGTATV